MEKERLQSEIALQPFVELHTTQIHHVDINAQTSVIGQIPTNMVGIVINDDVVCIPEPSTAIGEVKLCNAESPIIEPEAAGTATTKTPYVAASETARETTMFKRTIQMEAWIVAALIVTNPLAIAVDVGRFGMVLAVRQMAVLRSRLLLLLLVIVAARSSRIPTAGSRSA